MSPPLRINFNIGNNTYSVPAKYVACSSCAGTGEGLMHNTCISCHGDRVELTVDTEVMTPNERDLWNQYQRNRWDDFQIDMMEAYLAGEKEK